MSSIPKILKLKDYITLIGTTLGLITLFLATIGDLAIISIGFFLISFTLGTDLLDGFIARKTGTINEMGKQLDSLSDSLTFGIVPAYLTFQAFRTYNVIDIFLIIGCIIFALGAILRLARFNISDQPGYTGVPTPLSGLFLIFYFYANYFFIQAFQLSTFPPTSTITVCILMVLFGWFNITTYIKFGAKDKKLYYFIIAFSPIFPVIAILGIFGYLIQFYLLSLIISIFFYFLCIVEFIYITIGFIRSLTKKV
ncbi:MAG: CDP-alcohol phosphatidyltransferase family protein [Promethearchaeota archaeon]